MARTPIVLVVDDDEDIRTTVLDVLGDEGYAAIGASNGREALRALENAAEGARPGLVLLDLMMPVMDGWEFMAALRRLPGGAAIPVVVFSAHAQVDRDARDLGVRAVLRKPLKLEELLDTVASFDPASAAG